MQAIKLLVIMAAIIAIAGIFIPQHYSVSRELVINAPVDTVYQEISDMNQWEQWTVWKEGSPPAGVNPAQMESGIGSGIYFSGTSGSGWFVIASNSVIDGFEYRIISDSGDMAQAKIITTDLGAATKVSWSVAGSINNPPVLAPYIAFLKEFLIGSELSQNLKNLNQKFN